jgi:membrane-bound lytic murein transglycosylase MltF
VFDPVRARLAVWSVLAAVIAGPAAASYADEPAPAIIEHVQEPWTGDFDHMVERQMIRVLAVFNQTMYFLDGADQRGITYDLLQAFEKHVNKALGRKGKVQVVVIPVARDRLLPALIEGRGDIAAANLTITTERQTLIDFADPLLTGVSELLVTGPAAGTVASLDDLAGEAAVYVRPSSSYFEHLVGLNQRRKAAGEHEIRIVPADENLGDEDLLEMVAVGLLPAIVVDSHKAAFWVQIIDGIVVHQDIAINTDGQIAWAIRKNNPQLKTVVNGFVKTAKKGTLLGNRLLKKYLGSTQWIKNALADDEIAKFQATVETIKKYAELHDFDWLMIAAQSYQESKLVQSLVSPSGAIGVMQVLPSTAADPNVAVPNIELLDNNVRAGVKYLRFLRDRYFSDPAIAPLDQELLSFAAYNAGPGNIAKARAKTAEMGFDPNRWFQNVELAAARVISREPVRYVRSIYKYYVAYKSLSEQAAVRRGAKGAAKTP